MDSGAPIDDRERKLLRDRARMLAAAPLPGEEALISGLAFRLGAGTYAVEPRHVREVHPVPRVTPLPGVPSFVRGIINVRGRIVSLLDLKSLFGIPDSGTTQTDNVIILQSPGMEFGLLVDEILGLTAIPISSLQPSLPSLTNMRAEYLKGITAHGLVFLDAARLLADKKLLINETVGSAG
jgi:purine-binding chemotaxis protein CheW